MDMSKMSKICCEKMGPVNLMVLRVVVGLVFLTQGIFKLSNIAMPTGMLTGLGFPAPDVFAWVLALTETICGVLLIVGFLTHFAIIPLIIVMIVAFFTVHLKDGLYGYSSLPGWFTLVVIAALLSVGCKGWECCSVDGMCTQKKKVRNNFNS